MYLNIASHTTAGHDWPVTAEFCVVYSTSTWPCGWDKESSVKFFDSRVELNNWLGSQLEWANLEDNQFAFQAYEWDLGPNVMLDLCLNTENLKWTYQQRVDDCLTSLF